MDRPPPLPPHPGLLLKKLFAEHGLNTPQAAEVLLMSRGHLSVILREQQRVTPNVVRQVIDKFALTGDAARYLIEAQARYDTWVASCKPQQLKLDLSTGAVDSQKEDV